MECSLVQKTATADLPPASCSGSAAMWVTKLEPWGQFHALCTWMRVLVIFFWRHVCFAVPSQFNLDDFWNFSPVFTSKTRPAWHLPDMLRREIMSAEGCVKRIPKSSDPPLLTIDQTKRLLLALVFMRVTTANSQDEKLASAEE